MPGSTSDGSPRRDLKATLSALIAPRRATGARATFSQVLVPEKPVPEPFTDWYQFSGNGDEPYAVFTPAQRKGLLSWTPASVLVRHGDALEITEADGREFRTRRFPLGHIDRVTFGKVLLRAWCGFEGGGSDGLDSISVEFNTVTTRLFDPLIAAARPNGASGAGGSLGPAADAAHGLGLKFINYAHSALRDGDRVELAIAQPEIPDERRRMRWRSRPLVTTHLLMLTDSEVILIGDDEEAASKTRTRHGGSWTYLPRRSIERSQVEEREDDLIDLELQLRSGGRVRSTFGPDRRSAIAELVGVLQDSAGV